MSFSEKSKQVNSFDEQMTIPKNNGKPVKKFLCFGAHPDDCDILFGGTAVKLARAGHQIKFVSGCNGDCGHYSMDRQALALRRYAESQASAKIAGIAEYQVLNHPDCGLENTLANREEIIRIIRQFQPDVVLSHRTCDYHADHRALGQLVMDAAYLVKVPLYCADTPIPAKNPVFAYLADRIHDPRPIRADVAVEIDSVLETVLRMLDCHASQFYEWLPWDIGVKDFNVAGMSWEQKKAWLMKNWGCRFEMKADMARSTLCEIYGETGKSVKYAEVFELSEYGEPITKQEFRNLFLD